MPFYGIRLSRWLLPIALVSLLLSSGASRPEEPPFRGDSAGRRLSESTEDSLALQFRKAVAGLTNRQLEERKATRRLAQQRAYAEILNKTVASDGLGALIEYLRGELRLEFFLPRNTLYTYITISVPSRQDTLPGKLFQQEAGPYAVPLPEDRSFPPDPWSKP